MRPKGEGWRKCPSVTPGGSAYFYARRSPTSGARQWYMRDRDTRESGGITRSVIFARPDVGVRAGRAYRCARRVVA